MNSIRPTYALFLTCFAQLLGCGDAGVDPGGYQDGTSEPAWTAPFGGSRTCYVTNEKAKSYYGECTTDCVWAARYNPNDIYCSDACADSWPHYSTSPGEACSVYNYHFTGGQVLSDLQAACASAVARDKACGATTVFDNCKTVAIVESPEMKAVYQCIASTSCGDSIESCVPPEDTSLESEICTMVGKSCSASICSPEARAALRNATPWLRNDTKRAAQACLQEGMCRNIEDCLTSWQYTTFAGGSDFVFFKFK